jgi:hypothetical protein
VRYRPKYGPLEPASGSDPWAYLGKWGSQLTFLLMFPTVILAIAGPDAALLAFAVVAALFGIGAILENRC